MYYFKGDIVKLMSGEIGEVIDHWGVARNWYKLLGLNKTIIYAMDSDIDSFVKRFKESGRKNR